MIQPAVSLNTCVQGLGIQERSYTMIAQKIRMSKSFQFYFFLSNLAYDLVILIEKLNGNLILSRFGEISEIVDPGEFTHRTLFWRQLHVTKPWPGIEAQCNYIGVSEILAIYSEILASLNGINFLKNRIFLGSGQNWINWIWSRQFLILLKWFFLSMVWLPQGERTIDS